MIVFFYKVGNHNGSVDKSTVMLVQEFEILDKSTIMLVQEFEILTYYKYEH